MNADQLLEDPYREVRTLRLEDDELFQVGDEVAVMYGEDHVMTGHVREIKRFAGRQPMYKVVDERGRYQLVTATNLRRPVEVPAYVVKDRSQEVSGYFSSYRG